MRVKIREVVDLDEKVDLSKLSPLERVVVGFKYWYRDTRPYKYMLHRRLEKEYSAKVEEEEKVKEVLLTFAYKQLVLNETMKELGLTCVKIEVTLERSLESTVREVIKHKEFISNNLRILECDPDVLLSFSDVPLIVEISSKALGRRWSSEKKSS